jgi:hypothetical protein
MILRATVVVSNQTHELSLVQSMGVFRWVGPRGDTMVSGRTIDCAIHAAVAVWDWLAVIDTDGERVDMAAYGATMGGS